MRGIWLIERGGKLTREKQSKTLYNYVWAISRQLKPPVISFAFSAIYKLVVFERLNVEKIEFFLSIEKQKRPFVKVK